MRKLAVLLCLLANPALAQDKISFGLDWKAEAEYGGYYQALATGLYAQRGLDVAIRQGDPQSNQIQLLIAGRLDFAIASNSFLALNLVEQHIPFVAIAAIFQKDPAALIAHPGQGNDSFEALRGKPIMIAAASRAGWWAFLRARFGYTDSQIRPYTFNFAPFLADPRAIQQGYVTSEPLSIRDATGTAPVVLLLADAGFDGYGSLIVTGRSTLAARHDVAQRFIDASIEGWRSYLHDDPAPANALIKHENPEMTDALLAYGRDALNQRGIVESGDAGTLGIGAMTDARWAAFQASVQGQDLFPAGLDVRQAYTLDLIGKQADGR